jgi:hypothetical protein
LAGVALTGFLATALGAGLATVFFFDLGSGIGILDNKRRRHEPGAG